MSNSKTTGLAMAILVFCLAAVPMIAQPDLANASAPIPSTDRMGTAIGGYDVVAYFDYDTATPGESDMFYDYENKARFRFASKVNMKKFMGDPDRYLPAYGGYCALSLGVAPGEIAGLKPGLHKAEPSIYTVVDGRLFLFSSEAARERWTKDENGCRARAEENWKAILEHRKR